MSLRFAINGFGRVGRALLRAAWSRPEIEIAAINDLAPASELGRLLARDTVHGPFPGKVEVTEVETEAGALWIDGRRIPVLSEPDPDRVDWGRHGASVVVEATGRFLRRAQAAAHLRESVRAVILSANGDPADPEDFAVCLGINEEGYDPDRHPVASNSSCTTYCLLLVAKVLHDAFGVRRALMSTVHSYTENQRLLDGPHPDPRRSRAAALNVIPTATTSARATGRILPELAGRIDGFAVRVPAPAVAMLDLVAEVERAAPPEAVRQAFREAAAGRLAGILGVTEEELVSSDFIGDARSAVVDLPLVQTIGSGGGGLVRVVSWYDNEWGYAHRLADLLVRLERTWGERTP